MAPVVLRKAVPLRSYCIISFSVDSRRDRKALERLIPESFRPDIIFNHFETGLNDNSIEGDGFIWESYIGSEFPMYALSVRKANGMDFTHEEVEMFLKTYAYDISPLVFVQARSNNQKLQEAIDANYRNSLPWHFNLPEI